MSEKAKMTVHCSKLRMHLQEEDGIDEYGIKTRENPGLPEKKLHTGSGKTAGGDVWSQQTGDRAGFGCDPGVHAGNFIDCKRVSDAAGDRFGLCPRI